MQSAHFLFHTVRTSVLPPAKENTRKPVHSIDVRTHTLSALHNAVKDDAHAMHAVLPTLRESHATPIGIRELYTLVALDRDSINYLHLLYAAITVKRNKRKKRSARTLRDDVQNAAQKEQATSRAPETHTIPTGTRKSCMRYCER